MSRKLTTDLFEYNALEKACLKIIKAISGYLEDTSYTLLYSLVILTINFIIFSFIKSVYGKLTPVCFSNFGSDLSNISTHISAVGSSMSIFSNLLTKALSLKIYFSYS